MTGGRTTNQSDRISHTWLVLTLCWLAGTNLRTVLLGVPPVLPLIQRDLRLSYTEVGLVSSIPIICMGLLAWPAASLIARIGGRVAVAIGLGLLTAGAILRGVPPNAASLFLFTFVLSAGVALAQTAMPILVRQWFPTRIGLAAAVYSNGLIMGEAVAAAVTVPVLLRLLGHDAWPGTFMVWGVVSIVGLVLWVWLTPPARPLGFGQHGVSKVSADVAPRAASVIAAERRRARVRGWHLGVLLGSGSLVYFGMNAWIPSFEQAVGRSAGTPASLTALNAAQIPVSFGVAAFAQRLVGRRWPFVVAGGVVLVGIAGWLMAPAASAPLWAALLGAGSSAVFVLGNALPSLLAGREGVARLTGATFSLSYSVAFVGPLLGGGLLDLTHAPPVAFAPVVVAGVVIVLLGSALPAPAQLGLMSAEHDTHVGIVTPDG